MQIVDFRHYAIYKQWHYFYLWEFVKYQEPYPNLEQKQFYIDNYQQKENQTLVNKYKRQKLK